MADNLRDLVVSLSLDGDNFSRNIKSINAQIRQAESEFKAAGAGVTDFEGTLGGAQAKAQMLSQKMELQSKAVEQYSRALEAAKAKLQDSYAQHEQLGKALDEARQKHAELAAAEGEDSAAAKSAADEVRKLESQLRANERQLTGNANAVTNATTNLNNANAALSETKKALGEANDEIKKQTSAWQQAGEALQGFSDKAKGTGEKLTGMGKTLSVGVTAPIVAMGAACYKAFGEVDGGLDIIITKTGLTGEALEGLQKSYENVFGSMPVSADEAATAIGEVNTRFGLTGEALEDLSREFIRFSSINGVDLNGSIDNVDTIMTKFGVDAEHTGEVLGYMTKVGQDTGISLNTLMSSLSSNGASLKELGLDLSDSISLLAQFEAGGVDASAALSGMKKAVQEATADGRDAREALTQTVQSIRDAASETDALAIATELFGAKGAAEMVTAIREGRLSVDELSASMSQYADVVSETYEATLDLPDQATVAMNKLKIAGSELASSAMTALEPVVSTLVEKAQGLLQAFQSLDQGTKERIAKIAALVALVGPSVALLGKLTSTVGAVTGAIGKFSTAVAAAGGGMRGLGSVLASSPALWMGVATAVAYGAYKLLDYISGAKATREALEKMNEAAEQWKNTAASTFYSSSKGLESFGLSASNFTRTTAQGYNWLNELVDEWKDELIESDETVQKYIDTFQETTDSTRSGLKELAALASANGYDEIYAQMQVDLGTLDTIDARVAELLKKRQENFLSESEIEELSNLISQRQEIDVKYKLSPQDKGFSDITQASNAALARAKATGQDLSAVYKDVMTAGAEGMAAINKGLAEEYDQRFALIQLMTDEEKKTAALVELDAWYSDRRKEYGKEYAATIKEATAQITDSTEIQQTYETIQNMTAALTRYRKGELSVTELADLTQGLDESSLTEFYALLTQIQSLTDQGLGISEIEEITGLSGLGEMLDGGFSSLQRINELLQQMDSDENLNSLRQMFSESLGEEVLKIATDLDMTGAKQRWLEFAKDPGSDVFTDAIVEAYKEKDGGADKSAVTNPSAGAALVSAYAKANGFDDRFDSPEDLIAQVKEYAKAQNWNGDFDDPTNLLAYVIEYAKAQGWTGTFDNPADLIAQVAAYAKANDWDGTFDNPEDLVAQVLSYAKAAGWNGAFDDPAGLIAQVLAYAKAQGWDGSFDDPTGLMAYVLKYAKAQNWTDAFDDPTGLLAQVMAYAKAKEWSGAFDDPTDLVAQVIAYGKAQGWNGSFDDPAGLIAQVLAYAKAQGWDGSFDDPTGLMAYVLKYAKAQNWTDAFDDPTGLLAQVMAYAKAKEWSGAFDGPTDLVAQVLSYAKAAGWNGAFDDPDGLIAQVLAYAKAQGWDGSFDDPTGLMAYVLKYAKAQNWTDAFDDPTGLLAQVMAYTKAKEWSGAFDDPTDLVAQVIAYGKAQGWKGDFDNPSGLVAQVLSYAKAQGWDGSFDDPTGLMAYVIAYAKAQGWTGDFDGPEGLSAGVSSYEKAKDFVDSFDGPTVTATVTLSALDEQYIAGWKAVNSFTAGIDTYLNEPVSKFGLESLMDTSKVQLYGTDGLKIPVTPEAVAALNGNDIVVGVDANGVYHVIVKPEWETAENSELQQSVQENLDQITSGESYGEGGKYAEYDAELVDDLLSRWMSQWKELDENGDYNYVPEQYRDNWILNTLSSGANLMRKGVEFVGDIFDAYDVDADEIERYALATESIVASWQNWDPETPFELPEEAAQYLTLMSEAMDAFNKSGRNMEFVNNQLAVLESLGIKLSASDLPTFFSAMAFNVKTGTAARATAQQSAEQGTRALERFAQLEDYRRASAELRERYNMGYITAEEYAQLAQQKLDTGTAKAIYTQDKSILNTKVGIDTYSAIMSEVQNIEMLQAMGEELSPYEQTYLKWYQSFLAEYEETAALVSQIEETAAKGPQFERPSEIETYTRQLGYLGEEVLDYIELYKQLGSSTAAWDAFLQQNGGSTFIGNLTKDEVKRMWDMATELRGVQHWGGELTESQQDFLTMWDSLEGLLIDGARETGEDAGGNVGDGIASKLADYDFGDAAGSAGDNLENSVRTAIDAHSPAQRFVPIGSDVAEGIAKGISDGTFMVTDAMVALANAALAAAKEALGIHSPSRVFKNEVGLMAMRGFGEGIELGGREQAGVVRNAARYLTGEAQAAVAGVTNTTSNYTVNDSVSFGGANFYVRSDADIHAIAREIAALTKREQTGRGTKARYL